MVLVVDDRVEVRELLVQFLQSLGFIAVPAHDGASAEVICETLRPDLILLDLVLPDVDGTGLIQRFKQQRPDTSVVVISGNVTDEWDRLCRSLGADEVLQKPINLKDLERVLLRLLRLAPADTRKRPF
jgi:CheY-like chemotaxis protein